MAVSVTEVDRCCAITIAQVRLERVIIQLIDKDGLESCLFEPE